MWLEGLGASFEASIAYEEEVAANDLAFSLRQDVDVREAITRSGGGWALAGPGGAAAAVEEVGLDYVRAGATLVPIAHAILRSAPVDAPARNQRSLQEALNAACRAGTDVTLAHSAGTTAGRLVRVAQDHVAVLTRAGETIVGLGALDSVQLGSYSASRGFSG